MNLNLRRACQLADLYEFKPRLSSFVKLRLESFLGYPGLSLCFLWGEPDFLVKEGSAALTLIICKKNIKTFSAKDESGNLRSFFYLTFFLSYSVQTFNLRIREKNIYLLTKEIWLQSLCVHWNRLRDRSLQEQSGQVEMVLMNPMPVLLFHQSVTVLLKNSGILGSDCSTTVERAPHTRAVEGSYPAGFCFFLSSQSILSSMGSVFWAAVAVQR